jgi:protein-disulfide isomerase
MSFPSLSGLFAALTTKKGAAVGAVAALAAAGALLTFGSQSPSTPSASAQTNPGGSSQLTLAPSPPLISVSDETSPFTPQQKQTIEKIVKDYLIQNPELMMEISKELEKRQTLLQAAEHKRIISEKKASIFAAESDFVMGNPNGDITVVEFFDYNCGWCKRAVDEVTKLVKADPNVRVVFKELPIFGENSTFAAKAAMASIHQGKYWDFHLALMKERQVIKANVFRIAENIGLNVTKLNEDMANPAYDVALKETAQIAQSLGIEGTPGFIVDAKVSVGFVPADGLQEMIAEIRKAGCQVC